MSENVHHLLIPYSSVSSALSSEAAAKLLQAANLPNLRQLLSMLTLVESDIGEEESFSPPHERALARLQGLPEEDGCIPWAAQQATAMGLEGAQTMPWSFVTLCHSVVGNGNLTMQDPAQLQVSEAESRQLLQAMRPFFAEDGLTLHFLEPTLWLCSGEPLRGVRTASLDRVNGKDLSHWQPSGGEAAKLRRLQNEMQMLLYTHTVNDARSRAKTDAINSIWFHSSGVLRDLTVVNEKVSTNIVSPIVSPRDLADAALKEDWSAWVKAWEHLDATVCADLLKRIQVGESVTLTLCGERSALRYELRQKQVFERLKSGFRGIFGMQSAYLLSEVL